MHKVQFHTGKISDDILRQRLNTALATDIMNFGSEYWLLRALEYEDLKKKVGPFDVAFSNFSEKQRFAEEAAYLVERINQKGKNNA